MGSGANPEAINEKEIGTTEALIDICKDNGFEPILVLEMTQPGATYFLREGASEDLARIGKDKGVRYFVAPATRPKRIEVYRNIIGDNGEIISTGVGPQKTGNPLEDIVNANLSAMNKIDSGIFNVGSGKGIQILELANYMIDSFGFDFSPIFDSPLKNDIKQSVADISLIQETLDWNSKTTIHDWITTNV